MKKLMLALLAWISLNTSYPLVSTLPEVQYRSQEELRQMYFCDEAEVGPCKVNELPAIEILALFDRRILTMYLRHGFRGIAPDEQSTLVHELVHYVQAVNRRFETLSCFGPLEQEAYTLESRWRVEQGLDPLPETPAIIFFQICPPGPT